MSGFLLILTFTFPGQPPMEQPIGLIYDPRACAIAGAGMAMILQEANPGLTVTPECRPAGAAT